MSNSDARGGWFDFDVQQSLNDLSIRKERKKPMKTKEGMYIDEKQKKMILDLFNVGQTFSNSYREGGIKYLYVSDVENLLDLIDDMKEGFGISPYHLYTSNKKMGMVCSQDKHKKLQIINSHILML